MQAARTCLDLTHVGGTRDGPKRIELNSGQCSLRGTVGAKPNLLNANGRQASECELGSVFDVHGRMPFTKPTRLPSRSAISTKPMSLAKARSTVTMRRAMTRMSCGPHFWRCEVIGAFGCEERFVNEVAVFGFTYVERQVAANGHA